MVDNDYQPDSRVFIYLFLINYLVLLDVSPKKFMLLKTFNWESSYIEVWFTDQNSKPIDTEGKTNITLVIN